MKMYSMHRLTRQLSLLVKQHRLKFHVEPFRNSISFSNHIGADKRDSLRTPTEPREDSYANPSFKTFPYLLKL